MNMEFNKIFAAVLAAGIVAMLAGFVADLMVKPIVPEQRAYEVAVMDEAPAGGPAAPATAEPVDALLASADIARGQQLSKACMACHTFDKGGANKIGPNLFNVMGGPKAHIAGFAYSDAMKTKEGSWTVDNMNQWVWNPKKFIPGSKMVYAGMKKPEDRAALIAWMQTLK